MNYEIEEEILENYEPALSTFMNLLEKNHQKHGLEFRGKSIGWMLSRLRQEEAEWRKAILTEDKICEAIDCSIMWFLIAQKHWLGA